MIGTVVERWWRNRKARKDARTHLELTERQAMVEECYQAMRSLSTWDRRVLEAPNDAEAYRHRALTLTLLGRRQEAQVDLDLAARLGLDRQRLLEEARTLRQLSLDPCLVETFGSAHRGWLRPRSLAASIGSLLPR